MPVRYSILILLAGMISLLLISGCAGEIDTTRERPVARIGANKVYDTSLDREVLRSMQVVKNSRRNDFYGFSPIKILQIMRGNLAYLVQATALVLPAGSLDKMEVSREAEKRAGETAQEVYEKLKAGGDWDELNEEYSASEQKDNGGKLTPFPRSYPGFPEGFFDLEPGDVLPPFKWSYWGHAVLRFDGATENPEGEEQYNGSMILIIPDEKTVKAEMIAGVLEKKQVEVLDPVLKGFDMFLKGDYGGAIEFLESKSPAPGNPDLGYYILSLCAEAKRDEERRLGYLKLAVENAKQVAGLRSYYEIEIGDILSGRGDESAGDYFRQAFDHSPNDMDIVKMTLKRFEDLGDSEYAGKAKARLVEMEAYIKRATGGGIPTGEVATGDITADKPDFEDL